MNITPQRYLSDKNLTVRYSVSRATIWRWAADPESTFPRPIKFNGATRWRLEDCERWEAEQVEA